MRSALGRLRSWIWWPLPWAVACTWSLATDENVGAAAVYGPPDRGFPPDGILALGERNAARWVFQEIDLEAVERVRREGQVLGHRDWPEQDAALPLEQVQLG